MREVRNLESTSIYWGHLAVRSHQRREKSKAKVSASSADDAAIGKAKAAIRVPLESRKQAPPALLNEEKAASVLSFNRPVGGLSHLIHEIIDLFLGAKVAIRPSDSSKESVDFKRKRKKRKQEVFLRQRAFCFRFHFHGISEWKIVIDVIMYVYVVVSSCVENGFISKQEI